MLGRIPVRTDRDDRYFGDRHQAMPRLGFTRMFERMLDHPNISILLQTDHRHLRGQVRWRETIYTGPVDEYFDYRFGKLPYRSLEFRHVTLPREWHQTVAVVNHPNEHDYTRVTEFKHLTGQTHPRTSVVYEYPRAEGDPYYPVPRPENAEPPTASTRRWPRPPRGALRGAAGHVPLLQHGPGGGPGAHALRQAGRRAATAPPPSSRLGLGPAPARRHRPDVRPWPPPC